MATFGEYLRKALDDAGMRPAELARRSGITKQGLSRLLNDTPHTITGAPPKPELSTVEKIARALGLDVNEARLAAGFAPSAKEMPPENLQELVQALYKLGIISHIEFADLEELKDSSEALDRVRASLGAAFTASLSMLISEHANDDAE